MHLVRCHDQKSKTLDEFYKEISEHDGAVDREIGKTMLSLLARLRALPDGRHVWGLTSHYRLCLLSEDSSATPWFVIVTALDMRDYCVEYLMPARVAPWPQAYVKGEARTEDDAVQMVVTAMEKSEAWSVRR
jgi:class 3 adenylate cyclase